MKRIAILSIIIENATDESIAKLNNVLHEYKDIIIGRMGVPDKTHGVNIISIALCDTLDVLNSVTGKIGNINNVSAKILISSKEYEN